jgi:hypothetical protein
MAIAFDVASTGDFTTTPTTPLTWSHTTSGSDRILFIGASGDAISGGVDDVTTPTYNGVSATFIAKVTATANRFLYLWVLVAPASGSNTVSIGAATNHFLEACAVSYTGAAQTGQPDNFSSTGLVADTLTGTVTTVADNCWLVMVGNRNFTGNPLDASTGTTRRIFTTTFLTTAMFDGNGPVTPAGSASLVATAGGVVALGGVVASFAPAGAAAGQPTMRRWGGVPFMGGRFSNASAPGGGVWGRTRDGLIVPRRHAA